MKEIFYKALKKAKLVFFKIQGIQGTSNSTSIL